MNINIFLNSNINKHYIEEILKLIRVNHKFIGYIDGCPQVKDQRQIIVLLTQIMNSYHRRTVSRVYPIKYT